jgi:hypothetical protein
MIREIQPTEAFPMQQNKDVAAENVVVGFIRQ